MSIASIRRRHGTIGSKSIPERFGNGAEIGRAQQCHFVLRHLSNGRLVVLAVRRRPRQPQANARRVENATQHQSASLFVVVRTTRFSYFTRNRRCHGVFNQRTGKRHCTHLHSHLSLPLSLYSPSITKMCVSNRHCSSFTRPCALTTSV